MSAAVDKPPPANHTIERLLALRPGESFTYYRGNFSDDVASSKSAPAYARLLAEIDAAARGLKAAGPIAVTERKVWLTAQGQRFTVTEYRALGLADASADGSSDDDYSGLESDEAAAA
jgi:hypothetical protein